MAPYQPPKGPLAARWRLLALDAPRAGVLASAEVELENVGAVEWRTRGPGEGVHASYHWLDELGNAIVWDGVRTPIDPPVAPGTRRRLTLAVRAPIPPGRYRLAFDLVEEHRFWFAEAGNAPLELEQEVAPRIGRALAARGGDDGALAAQQEPLVPEDEAEAIAYLAPGCAPPPDWSRRVLDAHQEGYAVVGGSVETRTGLLRGRPAELEPWTPGRGRVPGFAHPLLCPSLVRAVEPKWLPDVRGLPALCPPADEPWLYDGRIRVTARLRSGRRRG